MNLRIQMTLLYFFSTLLVGYSQQQPIFFQADSIQNDKAYAQCLVQPIIKDTILHVKRNCSVVCDTIIPKYDTSYVEIVVKPPSSSVYPIRYDTIQETITRRIYSNSSSVPYGLVTEQVMTHPSYKKWVLDSENNQWHLVPFPANYITVERIAIRTGGCGEDHYKPIENKDFVYKFVPLDSIPKHLIDTPAETVRIERVSLISPRDINPRMECTKIDTIGHRKITRPKDPLVYKEILPEKDWKDYSKKIKAKLKKLGYLEGAKNRKIDASLKEAIIQYQVDNNLAIGQLTLETIEHLDL